jgi:outer membrane protein assembly factor BamB
MFAAVLVANSAAAVEPAWEREFDAPVVATPVAFGEHILVAAGGSLVALGPKGKVDWELEIDGELLSTPAIADQRIYVHSSTGLTALNQQREILWHYAAEDQGALVDGRTWGWGDALRSDPWAFYRSSPLVTENAIVFGGSDGVHAVDPDDGKPLWHQRTAPVTADIVGHEDSVIVADWSNRLRRMNVADGAVQWSFSASLPAAPFDTWIGWTGLHVTPAIVDGEVYLGNRGTYFYSLDIEKGTERWSTKHGTTWIGSPALVHEDQVYFGLSDGKALLGYERSSGNPTLFVATPGPVFAKPIMIGQHLIAGTLSGSLLVVDLKDGRLVHTHRLHDDARSYQSYFQSEPDPDLTPYENTLSNLKKFISEQQAILSLAVIADQVLVGTGSGHVLAFAIEDLTR